MKCSIRDHEWRPSPRGTHEICARCGDRYPCAGSCGHYDCIVDTGRELPEHITLVTKITGDQMKVGQVIASAVLAIVAGCTDADTTPSKDAPPLCSEEPACHQSLCRRTDDPNVCDCGGGITCRKTASETNDDNSEDNSDEIDANDANNEAAAAKESEAQ